MTFGKNALEDNIIGAIDQKQKEEDNIIYVKEKKDDLENNILSAINASLRSTETFDDKVNAS